MLSQNHHNCCSRRLSVEQMMRAKRVPATSSVTMTSQMCEDITYDTHMRTETLYLHNDLHEHSKKTVDRPVSNKDQGHVQGNMIAYANLLEISFWRNLAISFGTCRNSLSAWVRVGIQIGCKLACAHLPREVYITCHKNKSYTMYTACLVWWVQFSCCS